MALLLPVQPPRCLSPTISGIPAGSYSYHLLSWLPTSMPSRRARSASQTLQAPVSLSIHPSVTLSIHPGLHVMYFKQGVITLLDITNKLNVRLKRTRDDKILSSTLSCMSKKYCFYCRTLTVMIVKSSFYYPHIKWRYVTTNQKALYTV